MATVPVSVPEPSVPVMFRNAAELQAHLGGVPLARIRVWPAPGYATEQDLLTIHAKEDRICELIDGILVEKPMGWYESILASVLIYFIETFLEENDLGKVSGEAGFLRLFPGCVRAPDVAFVSWKRIPGKELPRAPIPPFAPDLAVEILSETNTEAEMERKLKEYFQAGCKLVWLVAPAARTVRVHTSLRKSRLLTEDDILEGGKVLPGFNLPIRQWFQRASRKPRQ